MASTGPIDWEYTLHEIVNELDQKRRSTQSTLDMALMSVGRSFVQGKTPEDWAVNEAKAKIEFLDGIKFAIELVQCYRSGQCVATRPAPAATQQ